MRRADQILFLIEERGGTWIPGPKWGTEVFNVGKVRCELVIGGGGHGRAVDSLIEKGYVKIVKEGYALTEDGRLRIQRLRDGRLLKAD